MCLIIDNNVVALALVVRHADFQPVQQALHERRATLVYSQHLLDEYKHNREVVRELRKLDQIGRTRVLAAKSVDDEMGVLRNEGQCVSNDIHIVAIARAGRVRLLCSRDHALHTDFTNPRILSDPRGSIYQNATHQHLIRQHCGS